MHYYYDTGRIRCDPSLRISFDQPGIAIINLVMKRMMMTRTTFKFTVKRTIQEDSTGSVRTVQYSTVADLKITEKDKTQSIDKT